MQQAFASLAEAFLTSCFAFYPLWASELGRHEYDGQAGRYDPATLDARARDLRTWRRRFEAIDPQTLSPDQRLDREVALAAIDQELFTLEDLRAFERNPLTYHQLVDITHYLKRDYAPLDERLTHLAAYQRQVPSLLETARQTLVGPYARPHVEVAVEVFKGVLQFLEEDVPRAAAQAAPSVRGQLLEANAQAASALRAFLGFLAEEVLPRATETFALGEDLFRRMLWAGERVMIDLAALLEIGEREVLRLREELEAVSRRIDPHATCAEVAKRLHAEHPREEELIPEVQRIVQDLRAFLEAHDLITLPEEDRLHIAPTPPFLRWAFAVMDTAGPFEQASTDSYYYLTLPDPAWTPDQKESWLRRFDRYTLQNTSVHEVYPGHHVHFLHVRRISSPIRKAFHAYSFVEGWAHYAEEMMVQSGYGDAKLRFAQLEDALLRAVRFVVSIRMHTQGMTVQEAARRFVEDALLEPLPAEKEAVRGTFDPGYLNYTLGKLMLRKLRQDREREQHGSFRLKAFHDELLQLGAPPIPVARLALLRDPGGSVL